MENTRRITVPNDYHDHGSVQNKKPKKLELDNKLLLKTIWKSFLAIAIILISRVVCYTILPYVSPECKDDPAQSGSCFPHAFSQRLVFCNLGGDLFGRFLTIILPRLPETWGSFILLVVSLIQFLFLNVVLLYVYTDYIPLSDIGTQIAVVVFATITGYLQTLSYAYAPVGTRDEWRTQVSALMNVATQAGNFLGLGLSFLLRLTIDVPP